MTLVRTALGPIRGRVRHDIHQFLGVPYAAPPVGDRRFRPPEPVTPWTEELDATRTAPGAPQPGPTPGSPLPGRARSTSEDCLFLNVYTPAPDDGRRPVLVWIHGGSYTGGSGDTYDGTAFARDGELVVVTLNYRLGALGFMELGHFDPELAGSQNNGIRDQIAALGWVRDHIAHFGGDPDQVTICGESAGAGSIAAILASPAADPLYQRAILQSPPADIRTTDTRYADAFLVGFEGGLDDLRAATAARIIEHQQTLAVERARDAGTSLLSADTIGCRPGLDRQTVTRSPVEAVTVGGAAKGLMIGTNVDEGTLFSAYLPDPISDDEMQIAVAAHTSRPDAVIAAFRAEHPGEANRPLMVRMLTDTLFRTSSLRLADARADTGGDVFVSLFTWAAKGFGGHFGAMHGLDIPFVWKQPLDAWSPVLGEGEPWPADLSERMQRAWIAFVRTGDPSHDGIGPWPRYDTARRPTMEFGETSSVLDDPHGTTRAAWG